jgi:hypothetical protein
LLSEDKPVFIIANHYGLVGQISFYLPEAKAEVGRQPLVYYQSSTRPRNQFYFWPGYKDRHGENAIFLCELNRNNPAPRPVPPEIEAEFDSVTDLGIRNVMSGGRLIRPLQFFACRGLR